MLSILLQIDRITRLIVLSLNRNKFTLQTFILITEMKTGGKFQSINFDFVLFCLLIFLY